MVSAVEPSRLVLLRMLINPRALLINLSCPIIASMDERFEYDRLIYDGKIAKFHEVGLKAPDGKVLKRELIRYPGAVVILPVLDDGSVVMIRNYRFAVDENLWELPAGMLEEGEDPARCAERELSEETGYRAGEIRKLGQYYMGPGTNDEVMYAYLATGLVDGPQNLEQYEQITVEILSQKRLREMILDGTVHDSKTISTMALYWLGGEE